MYTQLQVHALGKGYMSITVVFSTATLSLGESNTIFTAKITARKYSPRTL